MDTIIDYLQIYFFQTRNRIMVIPVLISFIAITIQLFFLSKQDLKYREIKRFRDILWSYPLAIFSGIAIYGISFDFFAGFFALMAFFYFTQIFYSLRFNRGLPEEEQVTFVGGADILAAPLFTVWFGSGIINFALLFLIVLSFATIKSVKTFTDNLCVNEELKGKDYISLFPCMYLVYILCILLYFIR